MGVRRRRPQTARLPGADGHPGRRRGRQAVRGRPGGHEAGRPPAQGPSFVLLRIENAGSTKIIPEDYLADPADPYGIKVTFRDRRVAAVVLTDPSEQEVPDFFFEEVEENGTIRTVAKPGFRRSNNEADRTGIVRLPKVMLSRGAEYKVLIVLERWPDDTSTGEFPEPVVSGLGGQGRWYDTVLKFFRLKATKTESHVFASRPAWWVIWILVAGVGVQACFTLFLPDEQRPPMDCAQDTTLHIHGSTAFKKAAQAAADDYVKRCEGAGVSIPKGVFNGSGSGLAELDRVGKKDEVKVGEASVTTSPSATVSPPTATPDWFPDPSPCPCSPSSSTGKRVWRT